MSEALGNLLERRSIRAYKPEMCIRDRPLALLDLGRSSYNLLQG